MNKFNFKWCVYILLCVVIMPLFCVFISPKDSLSAEAQFEVSVNEDELKSIKGDFVGYRIQNQEDVFDALNNFKEEFGFDNSRDSLVFVKKVKSVTGNVYRFYQQINGIKVYGSEVIVNTNQDGRIISIKCSYYKNLKYNENLNYSINDAQNLIKEKYEATSLTYLETNIYHGDNNCLSYVFEVYMLDDIYKVLVCANHLDVIKIVKATASLDDVMLAELPSLSKYTKSDSTTTYVNVDGETVTLSIDKYQSKTSNEYFFILGDSERAIYVTHGYNQTDEDKVKYYASFNETGYFNDVIAVRAYDYILKCYDFYKDKDNFGVSIDGLTNPKGEDISLIAIVHYDNNYENAAFYLPYNTSTTGYFYFGDGNALNGTGSFVNGLDVVAHEYQHCITDSVVELEYFNESGAICEAYSDIFGACVEGYELNNANFWKMGEDIYTVSNRYFRDMSDPAKTNCTYSYEKLYPLCTSSSCTHSNCDNGGVHYNSTLMTYATYVMYLQDTEFFTKTNILKLWYQTLTKLSAKSTFIEFAELMIESAEELGFSEENILDIEFAFAVIDLPGYTGVKVWGDYNLQYLQGAGNIVYPYLINSPADLASVAYYVNSGDENYINARYQVNVDLDLKNIVWEGIGTKEHPFNGVFNGGEKTITGLNVAGKTGDIYAGLFNYTGDDAYIYNVRIASGNVSSQAEYVGAIAGLLKGTISGCSSSLNITGKNVGGLVGLVVNTSGGEKVVNSFVTADLEGEVVGGLVAVFATPLNTSVNLYVSGYVTSSYVLGTLTGGVVGGIAGKANGLYLANVISFATLQDNKANATLGGLVGDFGFNDALNNTQVILNNVSNMILGSKVFVSFNDQNNGLKKGLLMGEFTGDVAQGTLYIENTDVKKVGNVDYSSNELNPLFIKLKDVNIVTDNVFEGAFDFDNEKFYKTEDNWTIINGIEAFDLVSTFEVKGENKMPGFINSSFWIDKRATAFESGNGTKDSPFIITTAEQLALFAYVICDLNEEGYNTYYSSKHYKLGADIDLAGNIWVGIGSTHINVINNSSAGTLYAFTGSFDGAGYSILNMSAIGAYSVVPLNSNGSNYKLIELSPALFGTTNAISSGTEIILPCISNLVVENVNSRGSYASGVVSKAYIGIELNNVSVNNGNITSDFVSGGLVASIDGLSLNVVTEKIVSNIINCDTQVNVSGRIAGGAVGYVTNASNNVETDLNVINYLNRGKISATGQDLDSELINSSSYYYRPIAGSVIGLTLVRNLNIINCINLGDVVSYNLGAYIGGFIGSVGINSTYSQNVINIVVDGCKQVGKIYYIFDNLLSTAGSVIGGIHKELTCQVNLTITNKTYTNQKEQEVANNNLTAFTTINSNIQVSDDELGTGDFDIYNEEYYASEKYFNSDYFWETQQRTKLFVSVTFRDYDGTVLGVVFLEKDQTSLSQDQTPVPERIATSQYEYVFAGWNRELTNIKQSISVYAEYTTKVRSYDVSYLDEKGNVIEVRNLSYGSTVNQNVEAPEKKSSFLFDYEFLRWGETGQTVTGEMKLKPVYKMQLSSAGKIILVSVVLFMALMVYISNKKKKEKVS